MLAAVIGFLFSRADARYPMDVEDNRVARRVHTQTAILRRVINVAIVVVAIGAILLTFPGVEALGASLLASAGILSVVAAIAAQSTLGNLFAGLQLAFSDAIRVDDVVVVNEEWGRIEEITLTYVVVHIWDDRRLVLPSTTFTTQSFENWTRRGSELLGSIFFDVDWRVSPARMREHLHRVLATEPLWDGRTSVLQVTDAVGGFVNVRILVTAANSGALWDLRCNVREAMVEWLQAEGAAALPRTRVELVEPEVRPPTRPSKTTGREGVFSGSAGGEDRGAGLHAGDSDRRGAAAGILTPRARGQARASVCSSTRVKKVRPSTPERIASWVSGPKPGSVACSGCGMSPTTLPRSLVRPAMSLSEPFGLTPR